LFTSACKDLTGEAATVKEKDKTAKLAIAKKLAITKGIIKIPANTASTDGIALYFLKANASFVSRESFSKKLISMRFIVILQKYFLQPN
jgi:hypothetical protein